MNQTELKVILSVFGEQFHPEALTSTLNIEPTSSWHKGDAIPKRPSHIRRHESAWEYSTEYVKTLNLQELTDSLSDVFLQKSILIRNFADNNKLDVKVDVVAKMQVDQRPSIYLNRRFLEMIHILNATVDFDFYFDDSQR